MTVAGVPIGGRAAARRSSALARILGEDALPVSVVCVWAALLVLSLPLLLVQDTWLALVDGRLLAAHGLPHVDTLAVWTEGRPWVDQQWAAQLALYGAAAAGGILLAALVGVALVAAALAACAVAARRLGASPRSAAVGVALPILGAPWLVQVRPQSFALVAFTVCYALLALDAKRPGRVVLWTLPLLAVWANLHGSVALGAALVVLRGLPLAADRATRRRGLALTVGAPLTLFASPYGSALGGYYRLMLLHPPLARYVVEWQPPAVAGPTAAFFVTSFLAAALVGSRFRLLSRWEAVALPLLLAGALLAVRNTVWFELAAAVSLPRLLDAARPPRPVSDAARRLNPLISLAALGMVAAVTAAAVGRDGSWLERGRPSPAAAAAVAAAAGRDGVVLADDQHADWLLWLRPELAGRIAYDVRFELLSARQLRQISLLDHASRPVWRRCGATARVVTFAGRKPEREARREGVLGPGARRIVDTPSFVAVVQPSGSRSCRL